MTLYQFSRLPPDQQAVLWKTLDAEIQADEAARRPTLVKKYYLAAMWHVMKGVTRKHTRDYVSELVPGSCVAAAGKCPAGGIADHGAGDGVGEKALDAA